MPFFVWGLGMGMIFFCLFVKSHRMDQITVLGKLGQSVEKLRHTS